MNVDRLRIQDRQAEEERICMRRLPKGAPVGGRVCQRGVRCKRCKGITVRGVSQSAEVRGRVRAEKSGRLCSSASRRRGERGVQRAGGDRRQLADKRIDQRNSVQKARARQGRSHVRPVARDAGLLPSVQCGTRKCLRSSCGVLFLLQIKPALRVEVTTILQQKNKLNLNGLKSCSSCRESRRRWMR